MNAQMLQCDVTKFDFKPNGDLEGQGYTIDVKKDIFRFPSIILLDLATQMEAIGNDSWGTLGIIMQQHSERTFAEVLRKVLAFACFSRLQCYLAMDSHSDQVNLKCTPGTSGLGDNRRRLALTRRNHGVWKLTCFCSSPLT